MGWQAHGPNNWQFYLSKGRRDKERFCPLTLGWQSRSDENGNINVESRKGTKTDWGVFLT